MLVIDFLKKYPSSKIVNCLINTPNYFEMIDWDNTISDEIKKEKKQIIINKLIEEFDKIKNKTILENGEGVLVVVKRLYDDEGYYDANLFDFKNFDINTYEKEKNPLYGLCFSNRQRILGLELANYCIDKYGEDAVIGAIAKELTSFSIFEEDREKSIKKNIESLEKACEESLNENNLYSFEEIYEELGLEVEEKTIEEKELERKESIEKAQRYINEYDDVIQNVYKFYK